MKFLCLDFFSLIWYLSHSLHSGDFSEIVPVYVLLCSTVFLLSSMCSCNPTFWKQILHTPPSHWNKCWEQTQSLQVKPHFQSSATVEPEWRLWWFLDLCRGKERRRQGQQQPKEIIVLHSLHVAPNCRAVVYFCCLCGFARCTSSSDNDEIVVQYDKLM